MHTNARIVLQNAQQCAYNCNYMRTKAHIVLQYALIIAIICAPMRYCIAICAAMRIYLQLYAQQCAYNCNYMRTNAHIVLQYAQRCAYKCNYIHTYCIAGYDLIIHTVRRGCRGAYVDNDFHWLIRNRCTSRMSCG
jgi:hypothetical protein